MRFPIVIILSLCGLIISSCEDPYEGQTKYDPDWYLVDYADTITLTFYDDCNMIPASNVGINFNLQYKSSEILYYKDTTVYTDLNGQIEYSYFLHINYDSYFSLIMSTQEGAVYFLDGPHRVDDSTYENSEYEIVLNDTLHSELHFYANEPHTSSDTLWYRTGSGAMSFITGPFLPETIITADDPANDYFHYMELSGEIVIIQWEFGPQVVYQEYPHISCFGTEVHEIYFD